MYLEIKNLKERQWNSNMTKAGTALRIFIVGEERNVIYKSRNAQEAYMKWNVYIGRKKERPSSAKNSDADHGSRADGNRANDSREHRSRDFREKRDMTDRRGNNRGRH